MYFFKRAFLYVVRKVGKAVILGFILFIVATLVLTGFLIQTASDKTYDVARNKLGAKVTYTSDLLSVMQNNIGERGQGGIGKGFSLPGDYAAITTKEVEKIAENSEYVKSYTISANLAGKPIDFSYYNPSSEEALSNENEYNFMKNEANINIIGSDYESKGLPFGETDEIIEGRYFANEEIDNASNVVIIEKTIANLNNINIGDSITVARQNQKRFEPNSDTSSASANIVYEVIGIYKTGSPTDISDTNFKGSFNLTENTMYAPYTTILSANLVGLSDTNLESAKVEIEANGYQVKSITFVLKDPSDVENFINEVKSMSDINTTYRSLNASDSAYKKMVGPIENVANTSRVLVIVVVIAGTFILGLLSMLFIRDRKYELGVLLSLGESRGKIVAQLITEMLFIAIISFSLAAATSSLTAQGTTNYLLNQEVSSYELESNNKFNQGKFFGIGGFMNRPTEQSFENIDVETIETLTVTINSIDILKMFGIGIIVIIIGNIMQASFVLRCNPKQILLDK